MGKPTNDKVAVHSISIEKKPRRSTSKSTNDKFIVNPSSAASAKKRRRSSGSKYYKYMLKQAMLKIPADVLPRRTRAKAYIKAAGKNSTKEAVNALQCGIHHYLTQIARDGQQFMHDHKRLNTENVMMAIRNSGGFFKCVHASLSGSKDRNDMRRFCPISFKGRAPTPKESDQFLKAH